MMRERDLGLFRMNSPSLVEVLFELDLFMT